MSTKTNKRLNDRDRAFLRTFAANNICCEAEQADFEKAYKSAKIITLKVVHAQYPVRDMKLLAKYGVAQPDACIQFGGTYDTDGQFRFLEGDKNIPLVPRRGGCSTRVYEWSKGDIETLSAYQLARQALKKAEDEKRNAYYRLINGSTTFNDIVAIWPAAESLRHKIIPQSNEQRALAVLSQEVIAMIQADNAGAKRVQA